VVGTLNVYRAGGDRAFTDTEVALVERFATMAALAYEAARQREHLRHQAATDGLTGLLNHRGSQEVLRREIEAAALTGAPLSVAVIDLDHFKRINDSFGHAEGDKALAAAAAKLRSVVRGGDAVGRLGGEEFVLVLPGVGGEAAAEAADRARAALSEVQVGRRRLQSSAGVATYPEDAQEAAELLERADAALYAAKHAGRRQTRRYAANLAARPSRSDERTEVEALLRRGDEAMHMVFQPVLELATGRVCGYEALARIDGEPVRRPDQWFAQAHRCGLGAELEALALHAALAVPGRPPGTFLALNVSPTALLAPPVADILPADLSDVVIELTEHELFTAEETLEACLAELRARGARVALDDAGAGYAGLQQVIRVAPDILKVDRSLVHGAHSDPSRYALLEALVSFAGTTGAAVCGEGVEDLADLRALADLDATYAQGYALARPADAWAGLTGEVAATADVREGVRVAAAAAASSGAGWARTLAELGDDLADVTSTEELATAGRRAARLLGAEDVSLMWVVEDSLELLSDNKDAPGQRWQLTEFPATMRLLDEHAPGQVVLGDSESDPDEVAELERLGYGAVLMVPVRVSRTQRALVEVYRVHPQAFTSTEVDRARVVAQQFGPVLARLATAR
jgi:diguanylate cyclase (GGDEF)-like protein